MLKCLSLVRLTAVGREGNVEAVTVGIFSGVTRKLGMFVITEIHQRLRFFCSFSSCRPLNTQFRLLTGAAQVSLPPCGTVAFNVD